MRKPVWKKKPKQPVPPPVPLPGGGPEDGYQFQFNVWYMKTRDERLWPFFYGLAGAPAVGLELTTTQRNTLADDLFQAGVIFDQEVDYGQGGNPWEPYGTMYQRNVVLGYTRGPAGQGTFTPNPPPVVNPADLVGSVDKQFPLLYTVDLRALYNPNAPVAATVEDGGGEENENEKEPVAGVDYQPPPYAGN